MAKDIKKIHIALDEASDFELVLEKLTCIEKLIKDQNLHLKEILNFNEACQILGFSSSHLYKCTARGDIPHFKPSKKLFFNRAELVGWMQQNRVCSNNELITRAENKIEEISR